MTVSSVTYCSYVGGACLRMFFSSCSCFLFPSLFSLTFIFLYTSILISLVTSLLRFFTFSLVKSSSLRSLFSLSSTTFAHRHLPINSWIPIHLLLHFLDLLSLSRLPPSIAISCCPSSVASGAVTREDSSSILGRPLIIEYSLSNPQQSKSIVDLCRSSLLYSSSSIHSPSNSKMYLNLKKNGLISEVASHVFRISKIIRIFHPFIMSFSHTLFHQSTLL